MNMAKCRNVATLAAFGLAASGCAVHVSTRGIDYEQGSVEVVATQPNAFGEAPSLEPSEETIVVAQVGCSKMGDALEPVLANVIRSTVRTQGGYPLVRVTYTFHCLDR